VQLEATLFVLLAGVRQSYWITYAGLGCMQTWLDVITPQTSVTGRG